MKKALLSFVAIAAGVLVVSATDATAWFNGGINGATLSGGDWTDPLPDGVTSESSKYALDDVTAFDFTADESKTASASANMDFSTTVTFQYAYDELPAIGANDKAGIIAYGDTPKYYVLAKDGTASPATNKWVDSEIAATLNAAVAVNVVISNGENSAVYAWYKIGDNAAFAKEIVASEASFQVVDYSGCGEISSLVGQLIALGIPVPGRDPIPQSVADKWAEDHGISKGDLAKLMADTTTKFNGRTFADSCILGVGTNENVNADIDDTAAADKLKFAVDCSPIAGRATFQLRKDGDDSGSWQDSKEFTADLAEGTYTIYAKTDGQGAGFIVSTKPIGVKKGATGDGFFAVPYADLEGDIAVADLFKKALLAIDDQIDVFDSSTKGWKTFQFDGTAWAGIAKTGSAPDPEETLLKRGQSFKFTRKGDKTPYYLGYVENGAATLSMPSKQYELVANADGSDFSLASKIGSKDYWAIKVKSGTALPAEMYKKDSSGNWVVISYDDKGKPTSASASTISGGFFLMNRGDSAQNVTF